MHQKDQNARKRKLLGEVFMDGDPLHFLINPIHFNMRNHITFINIVKGLIVLYLEIFNAIGIVYIVQDNSGTYMQQYLSAILAQQIGITSLVLHIYYTKDVARLYDAIKSSFLPLDAAGKEVHQNLLRQCFLAKKLLSLAFITAISTLCNILPLIVYREDVQFTVTFIKKHFYVWSSNCFLGIYYSCLIALGYSIASICTACLYLMMHLKFQFHLLSEYLKQISYGHKPDYEDDFYQEAVKLRLRSFVQAHNQIETTAGRFLEIGKWPLIVLTVSSIMAYTAFGYFVVSEDGPTKYFRCGAGVIAAGIISFIIIRSGQQLQDEYENLYNTAWQCDWVHWNVQNKRSLMLIIINTSKVMKMTSFGILDLGHDLFVRMLKVSYSMVLLFVNVNK